jgi:hypothetical protein
VNYVLIQSRGRQPQSPAVAAPAWSTLKIGGGGFVTGYDIAPDNTMLARSDTFPAVFLWSVAQDKWLPLVTANSIPAGFISPRSDKALGAWEARICPSNTSKFYMVFANAVFVTTNSGASWTQLAGFTADISDANANDNARTTGWRMAVDPQNDAICYIGTPSAGLQVTFNGGASWSTVSGVAASASQGIAIAFDPTSGVSGGKKQGIFACSEGHGVYHSTDGGATWALLNTTGMPTSFFRMKVDQNGKLWLSTTSTLRLWTWTSGGGWVQNSNTDNPVVFDIDPNNANRVAVSSIGGRTYISTDGAATFGAGIISTTVTTTGDVPWQGMTNYSSSYNYSCCCLNFDSNSVLYQSHGLGVWKSPAPFTSNTAITWNGMSRGIEIYDAFWLVHPPGGNPVGVGYDLPIWNFNNPNSYPSAYGPDADFGGMNPPSGATPTFHIDYAGSDPTFMVAATTATPGVCYSLNRGLNWAAFSSQTPFGNLLFGGNVVASTNQNLLAFVNGSGPKYTTNRGALWSTSTYTGNAYNTFSGYSSCLAAADRVTAGAFVVYSLADGFYSSTDGGANFARVSTFNAGIHEALVRIKSVPGKAGHLFFSGGFADTGTPPDTSAALYWNTISAAGALTENVATGWKTMATFTGLVDFDFGTIVAGQSYPTLYVVGWRSGAPGIWMCQDFNPTTGAGTWTLLGNTSYPEGWYSLITCIAGDPNVDGQCSIGFKNGGFKRYGT